MPRARRTCSERVDGRNCPQIATVGPRCAAHHRTWMAGALSRQERGYDAAFDAARRGWDRRIRSGALVACWRCGERVSADQEWHLGHDDRRRIRGLEHAACNLTAPKRRTPPTA